MNPSRPRTTRIMWRDGWSIKHWTTKQKLIHVLVGFTSVLCYFVKNSRFHRVKVSSWEWSLGTHAYTHYLVWNKVICVPRTEEKRINNGGCRTLLIMSLVLIGAWEIFDGWNNVRKQRDLEPLEPNPFPRNALFSGLNPPFRWRCILLGSMLVEEKQYFGFQGHRRFLETLVGLAIKHFLYANATRYTDTEPKSMHQILGSCYIPLI